MRSNKNTGFLYYAERGAIMDYRTDITPSHRQNPDLRQNPNRHLDSCVHLNPMRCLPAVLRILHLALQNLCCESSAIIVSFHGALFKIQIVIPLRMLIGTVRYMRTGTVENTRK